ncbi:hypothetical protein AB0B12_32250 [Streptomyces sp. NPDC044780]|nr:hypothetical protein [Streptomyces sp. S465]WAP54989.1 hypothetical protein N6H00_08295 [Streptomyces sp. S465]
MTAEVADAPRVPARTQPAEPFEGHARSGDVRAAEHGEGTPPWNEEDAA